MKYPLGIHETKVHARHKHLVLVLTGGDHRRLFELDFARFLCECAGEAAEDCAARWIYESAQHPGNFMGDSKRESTDQSPQAEPLIR